MQGFRDNMEDTHVANLQMPNHKSVGLFGVFDGHSGTKAAEWCATHIPNAIDQLNNFSEEEIKKKMIEVDQHYLESTGDLSNGATAVFCMVEKKSDHSENPFKVTVVNLGDSRCFVGSYSSPKFTCLTKDHKPGDPEEVDRIKAAGGYVARGRIDSLLSVSRAFGDHQYKSRKDLPPEKQKVIPVPDITRTELGPDNFLLVCCDGLITPQQAEEDGAGIFQFLHPKLSENADPAMVLSRLLKYILKSGSMDNMTVVVVEFKNGEYYHSENIDFIAGKCYEGNSTYLTAFSNDCKRNGKSVTEVKELWKKQAKNGKVDEESSDSDH